MHIAIFLDQHPSTLGGAQVSVRTQARFLRKAGHIVTICAPSSRLHDDYVEIVTYASLPLGRSDYALAIPSKRIDRQIDEAFDALPPVDIVHVQADFWGAMLGFSFARRHNLPTVLTYHNNVEAGTRAVLGPFTRPYLSLMAIWARRHMALKVSGPVNGWSYLAALGEKADARTAPTSHFAQDLTSNGAPEPVTVISNGLDDDQIVGITSSSSRHDTIHLIWTGRFSQEKRVMEFLQAVAIVRPNADIVLYGSGPLETEARRYVQHEGLDHVRFAGAVSHDEMIQAIADSDALIQTSVGFETQGLTVLEALAVGTPVALSDPAIAADFSPKSYWLAKGGSTEGLAELIKTSVSDIASGRKKEVDQSVREAFLQSTLTGRMVSIYEELLK
jgi:glycosyltransferase involved in cell wall biosynthesis